MLSASTSDFLSPDGAVLTDPAQVERALAAMWKPAADQTGGEDRAEPVTRVCAGNLIVAGQARAWGELSEVLGELSPEHPTRTIVLLIEADDSRPRATSADVRASVSALCHLPQPERPQVCCEQIVLRAGLAGLTDVDRTILPLLEPEVPTALWWTIEPASRDDAFTRLGHLVDRVIIDAGWPGFAHLNHDRQHVVRELGWYRTRRWRELLATVFDGCEPNTWQRIDRLSMTVGGRSPDSLIDAAWLIAFVGGQLDWQPARALADSAFELTSPRGPLQVTFNLTPGPCTGLGCVRINAGQSYFEIGRCATGHDAFRLIACDERMCGLPRAVQVPDIRRSNALAAALTARPADPAFDRALPLARWLARQLGADDALPTR